MRHIPAAIGLAGALVSVTATGQPAPGEPRQLYDQVDLMATAAMDVQNDLLSAVVFAEVEDNDQEDAADAVNDAISWAADRARAEPGIEIKSTNYSTRPIYANGRRITGWVARQSMQLESRDSEALGTLLGELQEQVAVQSINYSVSESARNQAEDALIADAIAQFNRRAELIASELGRQGFRIVRLNVGTTGMPGPQFYGAADEMRAAASAAPEIEAGAQRLAVTVSGTVELGTIR